MSNTVARESVLPLEIQIEIHSRDPNLAADLCGFKPQPGNTVDLSSGSQLRYYGSPERSGAWPGLPEIFQFGLSVAAGVTAKILGELIFERIKGKKEVSEFRINKKLTEFSADGIKRVIEESIEFRSNAK
jgi:hypothetical protein